jgi:hypothetical protein
MRFARDFVETTDGRRHQTEDPNAFGKAHLVCANAHQDHDAQHQQYRGKIRPVRNPRVPYPSPQHFGVMFHGFPRWTDGNRWSSTKEMGSLIWIAGIAQELRQTSLPSQPVT